MRRLTAPIVGLLVGLLVGAVVLFAAWLFWAIAPRFEAELVRALPGPGAVTAEHSRGSAGATTGFVDVIELTAGRRTREVLRIDRAGAVGLHWMDAGRLKICTGDARVLGHEPEVTLGGETVRAIVAPLPAEDCAK